MRLGIRGKQIAGVTAIVGVAVVVLSSLYVTRLARVVLRESESRARLLARAIEHRTREIIVEGPDPYRAVRTDPGLFAILQSSLYGEGVADAAILDTNGVVVANWDQTVGGTIKSRTNLSALADAPPLQQLRVIYSRDGEFLEFRLPIRIADRDYGWSTVVVSTLLMRKELIEAVKPAL